MTTLKVNDNKLVSEMSSSENLKKELMIAQEINFAKVLAGNDKITRDRAVKKLVKWLAIRSKGKATFTEDNFNRIWSGLFYCMWMSDKFLVQEELAESISKLIHCFHNNKETALLFIKCFHKIMAKEWPGIDQHRFDKFCMLIRRFMRQSLEFCRRTGWEQTLVKDLCDVYEETVLNHDVPSGILLHFIDIYPEEIAKVSSGKLDVETSLILYEPIIKLLTVTKDKRVIEAATLFFKHLIRQTSIGIEYEEKLEAWKNMGMPSDRPEELEMALCNDEDVNGDSDLDEMLADGPMDPRAGKVNVILPNIPVDFNRIISIIERQMKCKNATTTGLLSLKRLKTMFQNLQKGEWPDKVVKPSILNEKPKRRFMDKCVKDLIDFTNKLHEEEKKEIEMTCNEVDSDDEVEESVLTNDKESDNENEKKSKSRKRKRKRPVDNDEKKIDQTKNEKKAREAPIKPKSPKNSFIVEDVKSDKLVVTPRKKRKALSTWQIHDLEADSEEYKKITVPKIIKLEKRGSALSGEQADRVAVTPVKETTHQIKLTPSFWDKAKEKALGKKRKSTGNLPLSPLISGNESKTSKKISFALERNEAQENEEYLREVRNSPSIPFDASRKPAQSALKSGLLPSPVNPFYRFNRNFKKSPKNSPTCKTNILG